MNPVNIVACVVMFIAFMALVWFTVFRSITDYRTDRPKLMAILAVLIISWLCWLVPWGESPATEHCRAIKNHTPILEAGGNCYVSLNPEGTLYLREGDQRVHVYTVEEIKLD